MSGWSKESKVKLLIKAYLSLNRNRKIPSKEISDWITVNNFGMNNTSVHANLITMLVKEAKRGGDNMLREVHLDKPKNGATVMWLE